jgi:bifunctional non-homologous end joining protein LigD
MPKKRNDGPLTDYQRKRDFKRTKEPAGKKPRRRTKRPPLQFVIQKHQATSLHFDLRLEVDGVMKSWAVPKGLSLDPRVKRLAMEVEDHPMEYNEFEGSIPKGEYGGGTVMLWDRGTYFADEAEPNESDEQAIGRGHSDGKISFFLEGERLQGSFALVRTERGPKPKWLVIKHKDDHVRRDFDPVDAYDTSVHSGRTMEQIAREEEATDLGEQGIAPMLYTETDELPAGDDWVYEEVRDGPRVLAFVTPNARRLVTDEDPAAAKYDTIEEALGTLAERTGRSFVLDGFVAHAPRRGLTFFVSDILFGDGEVLIEEAWEERRRHLEELLARRRVSGLRLTQIRATAADAALRHAQRNGWAGILARKTSSPYRPGTRSREVRLLDL